MKETNELQETQEIEALETLLGIMDRQEELIRIVEEQDIEIDRLEKENRILRDLLNDSDSLQIESGQVIDNQDSEIVRLRKEITTLKNQLNESQSLNEQLQKQINELLLLRQA